MQVEADGADKEIKGVEDALEEARKSFPAAPEVDRYEWRFHVDSTGDDAVLVTVILKDPPGDVDLYDWNELAPIRNAIADTFQARKVGRWPYVQFVLERELEELKEDDDDERGEDG